jgi:hypothetical protein
MHDACALLNQSAFKVRIIPPTLISFASVFEIFQNAALPLTNFRKTPSVNLDLPGDRQSYDFNGIVRVRY